MPKSAMQEIKTVEYDCEYAVIHISNGGTIQIKFDDDGISVDILTGCKNPESIASTWATYGEIGAIE